MVMDIAQQQDICWMSQSGVITIFIILPWSLDEGWDVVTATQQDIQHTSCTTQYWDCLCTRLCINQINIITPH